MGMENGVQLWQKEQVIQQVYLHKRYLKNLDRAYKAYREKGFHILKVSYGVGYWIAIMSKGTEYSDTRYDRVRYLDEFRALISKRWEEGYALIDVERAEGYWFGVFAKGSKVKREAYDIVEDWKMLKV